MRRIGYIGLGNMGAPIARAMCADHELLVYDLSDAAIAECVSIGAKAASVTEIATACGIIFLCLPTFDHVARLLAEDGALVANAPRGTVVVDQSTSHPGKFRDLASRLATKGITLIDAPVSGGPRGVEDRSLVIMLGGEAEKIAPILDVLRSVTDNLLHSGPVGTAMMVKVANNYVGSLQTAVALEAFALAVHAGCDPEVTALAMEQGSASNHYIRRSLRSAILTGNLEAGATISILQKDVRLALEVAEAEQHSLLGGAELVALIDRCVADYGKDASYNALALTVSDITQTPLGGTVGRSVRPAP